MTSAALAINVAFLVRQSTQSNGREVNLMPDNLKMKCNYR